MATTKQVIIDALEELTKEEFYEFRWQLVNGIGPDSLPRGKLEEANRHDVVDYMVQRYGNPKAGTIAVEALYKIKQNELAGKLRSLQEVPGVRSRSEVAGLASGASSRPAVESAPAPAVDINASGGGTDKAPVLNSDGPVPFNGYFIK